jgi:hypothetical protein
MPKRKDIQSTFLIGAIVSMLTVPAFGEVTRPDDGPPGFYSVGAWQGRCLRDGWLNGSKNESCGAELLGTSIDVYIARTVKGLTVSMSSEGCKKTTFKAAMSKTQLSSPDRAIRLETLIQGLLKKEARKCGPNGQVAAPITRTDLADILTETDGLEF